MSLPLVTSVSPEDNLSLTMHTDREGHKDIQATLSGLPVEGQMGILAQTAKMVRPQEYVYPEREESGGCRLKSCLKMQQSQVVLRGGEGSLS